MNRIVINKKVMYISLGVLMLIVFSLGIVYAALSTTLNINGNTVVNASNWDIYLTNAIVSKGSVSAEQPYIYNRTTAVFSVTLNKPGDYYELTVEAVNDGDIDAVIESISKTSLNEAQEKYLNYVVMYKNGDPISSKQLLQARTFKEIVVRVEYKKNLNPEDLPTSVDTVNLSFTINYVQSNESNNQSGEVPGDTDDVEVIVVSGNGSNVGDIIKIKDEEFYVMNNNGTEITMFAKYNLQVGRDYNYINDLYTDIVNSTGRQDVNSRGYTSSGGVINRSVLPFSSSVYWNWTEIGPTFGKPVYIYSEDNVQLYSYINNYKQYIESLGIIVNDARLISYDELKTLGCTHESGQIGDCTTAPSWVYFTSYWTGMLDVNGSYDIFYVNNDGTFCTIEYYFDSDLGLRPVIVIPSSLI